MKIILTNGVEIEPIAVTGGQRFVQGTSRDTLSFVFPESAGLDELDKLFTPEACETIIIVEGENQYIHKAYTVRAELMRTPVEVTPATGSDAPVYENRVTISMSQRTYAETQMAAMQAAMNALLKGEG